MTTTDNTGPHSLGSGVRALRPKWGWIVGFGVFSLIAGVIALGSTVIATASAVYIVGFMMLFAGAAEIVAAFNAKDWGHRLLWLLLGALYVFAGFICLQNPFEAATILTLLLGIALIVGGLVRIFLATQMKHGTPWGWVVFSGILSFLLGLIIVAQWPVSSFFVLGIFLGIDLIFIGSGWITIGLALKKHT
ncbi:MAG: HdeD family acid-resistance protein [Alphaproteobacteria bacterium]|nr:MAG: HdeD family acid-resistance protein [Alphaproteobacteria bacterium]